jgi:hypothetical protein
MYSHTSSGDLTEPSNYRPIVLISVLSKLFTSILTDRLLSWSEDEDKLIDNQFGFPSGFNYGQNLLFIPFFISLYIRIFLSTLSNALRKSTRAQQRFSAGNDSIIGEMVTACPLFLLRYSRNFLIRYFLMERIQKVGSNV